MWRRIVIILSVLVFHVSCIYVEKPGPRYPPTKGEIWPKPQHEKRGDKYFTFHPSHFKIEVLGHTCDLLTKSLERYDVAEKLHDIVRRSRKAIRHRGREYHRLERQHDPRHLGLLRVLEIDLTAPCEDYPSFNMKENYNLTTTSNGFHLTANSIWGIMRGFGTFFQLFYIEDKLEKHVVRINITDIHDFPRYPHRGLLLDTSRHFVSVENIIKTLDAMALNKMNVFHWHIVDDQSFPYESAVFPQLSAQGAYHPTLVYTQKNISDIIEHAKRYGIRVIPEFDVPGHTRSWGVAYPDILTKCYENGELIGLGPMNPINNSTYKIIKDLFAEVGQRFPDNYFHLGGDEVELACWSNNAQIKEYMKNHNITTVSELHALFMRNVIPLLAPKKKAIVWQEVFQNGVPLSKDTLIQVWKRECDLLDVVSAGHLALYSTPWYLDHLASGGNFEDFYLADDPDSIVSNETLAKNVMGGEACMWGEVVDDSNVISRVWPRASAVAERLWSAKLDTLNYYYAFPTKVRCRLEEQTCRMIRSGVAAQPPNGPGFCLV